jgi:cytosine/uracil/thiamine/allantoin permease
MTWSAVGQVLPSAIAISISPLGIALVVLTLMSPRAKVCGPLFALGWMLGIAILATVAFVLADAADVSTDEDVSTGVDLLQIALAALFFFIAYRAWSGRPRAGDVAPEPKILSAVATMPPLKVAGLGLLSASANFKSVPLAISAGTQLAQTIGTDGSPVVALVVFALASSVAIVVPVAMVIAAGERARSPLASLKAWLVQNMATITIVTFLLMGASSLGHGLPLAD